MGTYRIVSTWKTPRSYVSSTMHAVHATVGGKVYKGRSAGDGMVFFGKLSQVPMTNAAIHHKLIHAVTNYDRKQSTKRGYNVYALAQYFAALDECLALVETGKTWQAAVSSIFNDRLESFLLRSLPA